MKQIIVGTYYAGHEQVQLVLREGTGGEFWLSPGDGAVARIKVGADEDAWWKVLAVLLHEITELVMVKKGLRFKPCGDTSGDHSAYVFHFDHATFSDICAKTGDYVAAASPAFCREWKAWRKRASK